jgi:MerR family transcriptional regulator, copper efflux regulator
MATSRAADRALLQIGEVAERVGLSLRTVRYYEEVGLVIPSARTEGRFRLYSHADVERLDLVKRMKPLGLTLEAMADLLDLFERTRDLADRQPTEQRAITDKLSGYAKRADERIMRIERDLAQARELRARLVAELAAAATIR